MADTELENRINDLQTCRKAMSEKLMVMSMENWTTARYEDEERVIQEDLIEIDYEIYLLETELKKEKKKKLMSTLLTIGAAMLAVGIGLFLAIKIVHIIEKL